MMTRISWWLRLRWALLVSVAAVSACGGGMAASPDGASPEMCREQVPVGEACNSLVNAATDVTPSCVTGTMPDGTGGPIVNGTYVLTSQTYYNVQGCPTFALSETITIAGDCVQIAFGREVAGKGSVRLSVQGSDITLTTICRDPSVDASAGTPDAPKRTYTATATSLTLFTRNAASGNSNPDRIETFARR